MSNVTFKGETIQLSGSLPQVGQVAPDFCLVSQDLTEISLKDFSGYVKLLIAVPSLDTPVCAKETQLFHEKVGNMQNVKAIVVSGDLPFAMKRFCTTASTPNMIPASQYRDMNFSKSYGTHIEEGLLRGLSARAVFIVDTNDKVAYTELVPDIAART